MKKFTNKKELKAAFIHMMIEENKKVCGYTEDGEEKTMGIMFEGNVICALTAVLYGVKDMKRAWVVKDFGYCPIV